jgi:hypothetical protein
MTLFGRATSEGTDSLPKLFQLALLLRADLFIACRCLGSQSGRDLLLRVFSHVVLSPVFIRSSSATVR